MRLLDPRFRYVPSAETDVTTTWRRFGFDARANAERRSRRMQRLADVPAPNDVETAAIHALVRKSA
jgi:hypothetical protein